MLEIILATLATYRVARMFALEDGAFDLFSRVRARVDPMQSTWLGRGLNCPLCIGFWIALGMTILLMLDNPLLGKSEFVLYWLAIAGGQAVLHRLIDGGIE